MTLGRRDIFIRYIGFAAIATAANLLTQQLVIILYGGVYRLQISILAGTGIGFILKYALDKNYVFHERGQSTKQTGGPKEVALYGLTGVLTTFLFWAIEISAWQIFHLASAKFAGAVLGIALGYWLKFELDKRFVFAGRRLS
jgi:putative flippase GtrA